MQLSQTKYDNTIMICIEFFIRKSILIFLGVPFLGGGPPKIPPFSGSDSERLERGPQCSARRRNFQKSLRTIVVLRIVYNPTGTNDTSSQCGAPTKRPKKCRFCPTRSAFWVSVAGHRGFWEKVSFHFRIPKPIRRTQIVRKAFWKIHLRAEMWGRFFSPFKVKSETTFHF